MTKKTIYQLSCFVGHFFLETAVHFICKQSYGNSVFTIFTSIFSNLIFELHQFLFIEGMKELFTLTLQIDVHKLDFHSCAVFLLNCICNKTSQQL